MRSSIRPRAKVRTTVLLDPKLVDEARKAAHASTNSEAIEAGLKELIRKAALDRLAETVLQPDRTFRVVRRRRPA